MGARWVGRYLGCKCVFDGSLAARRGAGVFLELGKELRGSDDKETRFLLDTRDGYL